MTAALFKKVKKELAATLHVCEDALKQPTMTYVNARCLIL